MAKILRCSSCGRPLSAPLHSPALETCEKEGKPYLPPGHWVVSDGDFYSGTNGDYILHLDDRRQLEDHKDRRRLQGCCGPDGTSGPNQVCPCGAEVATLRADCWLPHAVLYHHGAVELVDEETLEEDLRGDAVKRKSRPRHLLLGLSVALSLGLLTASIQTYLDWRLNPSGIFHGAEGTSWPVVWETWISWFTPGNPGRRRAVGARGAMDHKATRRTLNTPQPHPRKPAPQGGRVPEEGA